MIERNVEISDSRAIKNSTDVVIVALAETKGTVADKAAVAVLVVAGLAFKKFCDLAGIETRKS